MVWRLSSVKSRGLTIRNRTAPFRAARPIMLSERNPRIISGNSVTTSTARGMEGCASTTTSGAPARGAGASG